MNYFSLNEIYILIKGITMLFEFVIYGDYLFLSHLLIILIIKDSVKSINISHLYTIDFILNLLTFIFFDLTYFKKIVLIINLFLPIFLFFFLVLPYISYHIGYFHFNSNNITSIFDLHKFKQPLNKRIKKTHINKYMKCPICLDIDTNVNYYVCKNNHYYHHNCIKKWINLHYNNKCPMCRE